MSRPDPRALSRIAICSILALTPGTLILGAGGTLAQERTPPTRSVAQPVIVPPAATPSAARDAELRALGETYRRSGDEEQDPGELARTQALNAEIAARNDAAQRSDAEAQANWQAAQDRYQSAVAAREAEIARIDAETAAQQARFARERAEWERVNAAYQAELAACRAAGGCTEPQKQ
jgi:hypothetical protein